MIFVTVGTSFPFDRLVRTIDDAVSRGLIKDSLFAQVGLGGYRPKNFDSVEIMKNELFDDYFNKADAIIAHAGIGTISTALEMEKPLLVMPRMKEFGELVNGHQYITALRFEKLGHVISVYTEAELAKKIQELKTFKPVRRECNVESVARRIGEFIEYSLRLSSNRRL